MNTKEHKEYLKEFETYAKEIVSTKETTQQFLIRSGINTKSGNLTTPYSPKIAR